MQSITPFLWFNDQAEEAMNFYLSVFKGASINNISRFGEAGPGEVGAVMFVSMTIKGQQFGLLNGNAEFASTPAVSFMVECQDQTEVDDLWDKLTDGGSTMACGWLTDKFGVTWQITPSILLKLLSDEDPAKSQRVMAAMMTMVKIDIPTLQKAFDGN